MTNTPINYNIDTSDTNQVDLLSNEMIDYVHTNPLYVQCLLHIKAYRDYHKEEREEFKERIEVLDERYSRYNNLINGIQISIIVLSAISAFVQAGNNIFKLSENSIQFISLVISSWSALTLSIAKYFKLDDQKENMNNIRQQCAEFMGELGAREDRLNTLCAKEIWAGPPNAPVPPALQAWENERDDMYNALKHLIQKKQGLVNSFEYIMDTQEAKSLIMSARNKRLDFKKSKLELDNKFLEYEMSKQNFIHKKYKFSGRDDDNCSKMHDYDKLDRVKCRQNTIMNSVFSNNKKSMRGEFIDDELIEDQLENHSPLEKAFILKSKENHKKLKNINTLLNEYSLKDKENISLENKVINKEIELVPPPPSSPNNLENV